MTSPLDLDDRSSAPENGQVVGKQNPPAPAAGPSRLVSALLRVGLLPVLLVAGVAVFASIEPRFLTPLNGTNIGRQLSFLLIITMAQMLVLVTAEIDMSVGSTIALTSVVSSMVMVRVGGDGGGPVLAGLLAGLGVGLVIGLINGIIVAKFRVPSFIVTIGSGAVAFGVALMLSSGSPITGLPKSFTKALGNSDIAGVPLSLVIALGVFALLYLLLNWTTVGRYFYAVGGGENAARLVGVPVFRSKVLAFVLCSTLTSLAAVLLTARVSSGEPNLGSEFVILSIAAAVLGGTSFFGGEGRLGMVAIGALFLVVLSNGMNLIRVSSYTQQVVLGVLLVSAVVIDRLRRRTAR
ncbi:monosaccharide ABC transporter membrane protein, CUT2 family [Micromonospora pattaloongensis]|uniref:Monosaccharide ABC transporter membrane protein, CUT2 family n=1 Tax=Micromonospora pattaloongensis TaxID=405436 RepID=A0A1H3RTL0_9ACTN|nr:ABC transporter permease [Micromonospora pattaloongensis]SDZ29036.1 monosaccharide ABC transporter membrane protein, CUT2 family [Micromonospora pattaloongensis]